MLPMPFLRENAGSLEAEKGIPYGADESAALLAVG